jgi:hypothetical protein
VSDPTTAVRPEVETFVAEVRARLADLTEEQREDLLDGLEADLSDQLADGADLGDPASYAAELRAAAGLPEQPRRASRPIPALRAPRAEDVERLLDDARRQWFAALERHPAGSRAWEVVSALRPAWWVARAWVLATTIDVWAGPWERISVVPTLGVPLLGPAVLVAAVVVSTLVGLGRLWPGSGPARPVLPRALVVAANVAAVCALFSVATGGSAYLSSNQVLRDTEYWAPPEPRMRGLHLGEEPVRNVFAYDATGQPIEGVQLFAADGRPLTVEPAVAVHGPRRDDRTVGCGWLNGTTRLFNVFPLAQRAQPDHLCSPDDPIDVPITAAEPPFAQVPPVTSPVTALPEAQAIPTPPRRP